jgi:hypothetical protein
VNLLTRDPGAPEAWLDVAAEFAEGLDGIAVGDQLLVFTRRALTLSGGRARAGMASDPAGIAPPAAPGNAR